VSYFLIRRSGRAGTRRFMAGHGVLLSLISCSHSLRGQLFYAIPRGVSTLSVMRSKTSKDATVPLTYCTVATILSRALDASLSGKTIGRGRSSVAFQTAGLIRAVQFVHRVEGKLLPLVLASLKEILSSTVGESDIAERRG